MAAKRLRIGLRQKGQGVGQDFFWIGWGAGATVDQEMTLDRVLLPESGAQEPRKISHAINAWFEAGDDVEDRFRFHLFLDGGRSAASRFLTSSFNAWWIADHCRSTIPILSSCLSV